MSLSNTIHILWKQVEIGVMARGRNEGVGIIIANNKQVGDGCEGVQVPEH